MANQSLLTYRDNLSLMFGLCHPFVTTLKRCVLYTRLYQDIFGDCIYFYHYPQRTKRRFYVRSKRRNTNLLRKSNISYSCRDPKKQKLFLELMMINKSHQRFSRVVSAKISALVFTKQRDLSYAQHAQLLIIFINIYRVHGQGTTLNVLLPFFLFLRSEFYGCFFSHQDL